MAEKPTYGELEERIHKFERAELEQKQTKEDLKLTQFTVDNSTDAVYWMGPDAKFIYVNYAAVAALGYSKEELLTMTVHEIGPEFPADFWTAHWVELKKKKTFDIQTIHQRKDGSTFPVEITVNFIQFGSREFNCAIARDITTQKIAAKKEKYALVGQIAGKMAHDFNNVLAVIMGNAQLALLDSKETNTIKTLELIFNQTIRGKNLTKNLVAFAKDQEPKQDFFRLSEKIDLVFNLLKKDLQGIEWVNEYAPGVPDLLADPGMIEHALVNLIQNSIHAISMVKQPRIIIRTYHKDKNTFMEIEDNGCGIPKEALDRIYEPAFTMKGSNDITNSYTPGVTGTGYGMANVKKYIEQHKGNILIDSKVGEGTKILISFPFIKKELTEKEVIEIQQETFYFEKYILLVEDELALSDVQYKMLTHEPFNHKVDIAATGQMAIDLFDRNKYDFISLDYILPGELNGMDVYHHIRKINKTVPILFVSGNIEFLESIKELKHKDSNVDHISKPCQNKDYVCAINDLLDNI